jgi:hypothetical protein
MTKPEEDQPDLVDEGDFAVEHSTATYAYEAPGGPERADDPDSPRGLAGADPDAI